MSFSRYAKEYDRMARLNTAYQENLSLFRDFLTRYDKNRTLSVCDIGAGTGNYIQAMHSVMPNCTFTHIDADTKMNAIAAQKYADAGISEVDIIEDYFQRIQLNANSFDLLICVNALYAITPPELVLRKFKELVKPGGTIFLIDFGRRQDVVDWGFYLFKEIAKKNGVLTAAKEVLSLRNVTRENSNTTRGQQSGDYWEHSTRDFKRALENTGFEIEDLGTCYRGYSDMAICRLPTAIAEDSQPRVAPLRLLESNR